MIWLLFLLLFSILAIKIIRLFIAIIKTSLGYCAKIYLNNHKPPNKAISFSIGVLPLELNLDRLNDVYRHILATIRNIHNIIYNSNGNEYVNIINNHTGTQAHSYSATTLCLCAIVP